jgi:hypothetical protein
MSAPQSALHVVVGVGGVEEMRGEQGAPLAFHCREFGDRSDGRAREDVSGR